MTNATDIRCANDLKLYGNLLERPEVKDANDQIEKLREEGHVSVRRRLLATSVRLSGVMAPQLHRIAAECVERLGLEIPLELYVYSSPTFNAACFAPEKGQLFVMFSSSLIEAFDAAELSFVMGHELGHHLYRHHDVPVGFILQGRSRPDPRLALDLFAWSRYAEISADRAGAHCARNPDAVALSLFKLASGLTGKAIRFSPEEFISQVDAMQASDDDAQMQGSREDWFSTHPFSPLRVKALQLFHESVFAESGGMSADKLELGVESLMMLMEPRYIDGHTDTAEAMRRLLFAGAIAVANASGEISSAEKAVFDELFGAGSFTDSINVDRLEAELDERIGQVVEKTSVPQRMQVLRDLCLMARAEDEDREPAREVLAGIANKLDVRRALVDEMLCGNIDLD